MEEQERIVQDHRNLRICDDPHDGNNDADDAQVHGGARLHVHACHNHQQRATFQTQEDGGMEEVQRKGQEEIDEEKEKGNNWRSEMRRVLVS